MSTAIEQSYPASDAEHALTDFRAAVERLQRHGGAELESLRLPLRRFCEHARREQMPPEQVLIRLKRALHATSPLDVQAAAAATLRNEIISFAIEAYYTTQTDCGR